MCKEEHSMSLNKDYQAKKKKKLKRHVFPVLWFLHAAVLLLLYILCF